MFSEFSPIWWKKRGDKQPVVSTYLHLIGVVAIDQKHHQKKPKTIQKRKKEKRNPANLSLQNFLRAPNACVGEERLEVLCVQQQGHQWRC